jgi:hypothetical protein
MVLDAVYRATPLRMRTEESLQGEKRWISFFLRLT